MSTQDTPSASFEPVFSPEELRRASLLSIDAIDLAVREGDIDEARRLVKRLRYEAITILGSYAGWEATLCNWIAKHEDASAAPTAKPGREIAEDAIREIEDPAVAPERCRSLPDPSASWRSAARSADEALACGDFDSARSHLRSIHEEALQHHDRGMSRVSALLSWMGRRYGPDAIAEGLGEAMASDMLGNASFRERAEALMHYTRVHFQAFELKEDAEKLTFLCRICPSGGRLLREGHYEAPRQDLQVEGPSWLTYGRESLPAYCCHEPVMEKASIEAGGAPLFIVDPAERLGEDPCLTYLYKDAADIPERFYTRLGLDKPVKGSGADE